LYFEYYVVFYSKITGSVRNLISAHPILMDKIGFTFQKKQWTCSFLLSCITTPVRQLLYKLTPKHFRCTISSLFKRTVKGNFIIEATLVCYVFNGPIAITSFGFKNFFSFLDAIRIHERKEIHMKMFIDNL